MKSEFRIQSPLSNSSDNIKSMISENIEKNKFDVARIAAAYVTVSGVRAILDAFGGLKILESCWLVGLDDELTQPGAIDLLLSLENANLRIASYQDQNLRFHPKVYLFSCSKNKKSRLTIIGSANLTVAALTKNGEAVAVMNAENTSDQKNVDKMWDGLWAMGHRPKKSEIDAYRLKYKRNTKRQKRTPKAAAKPNAKPTGKKANEILRSDVAELDPALAKTCWIECGNVTAMGRELEFKAEQGLFFGLNPSGGPPQTIRFKSSAGTLVPLRMKYQQNHMWRLQMNNDVPEVKKGLRKVGIDGKLLRSNYVAVFKRTKAGRIFEIKFVELNSFEFRALLDLTIKSGTFGKTSARKYGWC